MNNKKRGNRAHQRRFLSCVALCILLSPTALLGQNAPPGEDKTSSPKSGIFVPLYPEPVHQLDFIEFTAYQVNFVFDLRDTPENRELLKDKFSQLDERGALFGRGRVDVILFGEYGQNLSIMIPPEVKMADIPAFPVFDPRSGTSYLAMPIMFVNIGNLENFKDIGRVIAVRFAIIENVFRAATRSDADKVADALESIFSSPPSRGVEVVPNPAIGFPLRAIQVIRSMMRPDRRFLADKLNVPSVNDPEVFAWDNRWLSMHPTIEQWAARLPDTPDPAAPETRQRWEVAVSQISQTSTFTLVEGHEAYQVVGTIEGCLYEDSFQMGKQRAILLDEEYAKIQYRATNLQPLMETLWSRHGSHDRGEWEEIGTQYFFDEGRGFQTLEDNTNLAKVTFDEEFFFSNTQGKSTTDTDSTTDTVSGNAGFEYSGFKVGGSASRAQTTSRSLTLSNSTTESRKKRLVMEKLVPPGNLNQIAMEYRGLVEEIRQGQFVIRRYREIKQVTLLPVWDTFNIAPDGQLKGYVSVTQIGADRAVSSFGEELDPESLAVLKSANLKDLGKNNFKLFGKWQQLDIDDGEITFVTVGADGGLYDGSVNKAGGLQRAKLSEYKEQGGPIATLTYQELDGSAAESYTLILDRKARDIRKIVFMANGNQPQFIWYAL